MMNDGTRLAELPHNQEAISSIYDTLKLLIGEKISKMSAHTEKERKKNAKHSYYFIRLNTFAWEEKGERSSSPKNIKMQS